MIRANKRNFLFEEVKQTAPERNGFDLSHENKQTCRANKLYPFELIELVPNDDVEVQVEQFIRLNPMLSPTMHRLKAYWHWFFCPNRLTWKYWEEFISRGNGKKLPADQDYTPPEPPTISLLTLLKYSPSGQFLETSSSDQPFFTGDYDEGCAAFLAKHPECHLVDVTEYTHGGTKFTGWKAVCFRTPRLANSIGIPDICYPFKIIVRNTDNGKMWLETFDTDQLTAVMPVDVQSYYSETKISLMPFTALFITWLDYYRDENLDDDYEVMKDYLIGLTGEWIPANETQEEYIIRLLSLSYRCWEKDYFTTATQLPQKSPDVLIPGTGGSVGDLSATTTISSVAGEELDYIPTGNNLKYRDGQSSPHTPYNESALKVNTSGEMFYTTSDSQEPNLFHKHNILSKDVADHLSAETTITGSGSGGETLQPTTVAQVRRAFALQRWFEKVVRTGTRYIESLKAFFNSDAGDARLQRPEYVGGSSTPIQISDVVQTSATDDNADTPQGNLAGYGMAAETSDFIRYHAPEHGFLIGYFSILARTSYAQGIPRLFSRETWLDYLWPEFEHIGEQAIKQKELAFLPLTNRAKGFSDFFSFSNSADPEHIFGYQSRYSEYKQIPDRFGSGFSSAMDFWSLGRIFQSTPTLSPEFVHSHASDRNFAVMGFDAEGKPSDYVPDDAPSSDQMDEAYDYDTYICDFWADVKKVTSLTLYSEPI